MADNLHLIPGGGGGGVMPMMSPQMLEQQEKLMAEQRRSAAVQLAVQSLHGTANEDGMAGYSDDVLIERARRIELFIYNNGNAT